MSTTIIEEVYAAYREANKEWEAIINDSSNDEYFTNNPQGGQAWLEQVYQNARDTEDDYLK